MKRKWLLRALSVLACLALTVGFAACGETDDGSDSDSGLGGSEIVGGNEGEEGGNAGNEGSNAGNEGGNEGEEQTPPSEGLEFAINDDGTAYSVTGIGACQDTKIVIPAEYEGLPVASIGCFAFYNTGYYNEEGNWEDGVLYIGKHLIKAKDTLAGEYAIKEGTLCVAGDAFYYCTSLTSVTIGNSVTSIGSSAFYYCTSLTSVYYKGTAEEWSAISIGSYTYLTDATRYHYSESEPMEEGNYWYYNENGEIVVW